MKRTGYLVTLALFVCAALFAVRGGVVADAADPATLAESKCAACHNLEKVCKALGVKDAAAWKETADRMASKGGAVKAEDAALIAPYLAQLKAGAKPICK